MAGNNVFVLFVQDPTKTTGKEFVELRRQLAETQRVVLQPTAPTREDPRENIYQEVKTADSPIAGGINNPVSTPAWA